MASQNIQERWFCCQEILDPYQNTTQAEEGTWEFKVFSELIEAGQESKVRQETPGYPNPIPDEIVEVMRWVGRDGRPDRSTSPFYFTQSPNSPELPWTEISARRFDGVRGQFEPKFGQVLQCPVHRTWLGFVVWMRP
jgi:hypothetical protein